MTEYSTDIIYAKGSTETKIGYSEETESERGNITHQRSRRMLMQELISV
jgi:hypothetical protein